MFLYDDLRLVVKIKEMHVGESFIKACFNKPGSKTAEYLVGLNALVTSA